MSKKITPQEEQILEESFEAIARDGIRFFTVDSLAQKMGMSKKTIYKFFPTKEALIDKTMDLFTGLIKRKFQSVIASDKNPVVQFIAIMNFILQQATRIPMEKVSEIKSRYPSIWKKLEAFRLERRDDFYTILSEAQQQGLVRSDLDMKVVATIYINLVNSTFQPEFFLKNNLAPEDTIRTFVKMITTGLFTDKGIQHVETI